MFQTAMASASLAEPRRRQKWTLNPRGNGAGALKVMTTPGWLRKRKSPSQVLTKFVKDSNKNFVQKYIENNLEITTA